MTGNYLLKLHSGERGYSRNIWCGSGPKAAKHEVRCQLSVRIIEARLLFQSRLRSSRLQSSQAIDSICIAGHPR